MKFTSILLSTLCLLSLFNPGNNTLEAQPTSSIQIYVKNHLDELQYWRPEADTHLTFEIEVTVPVDFASGTLGAALQNVTNHHGISGNVPSTIIPPTQELIDANESFPHIFSKPRSTTGSPNTVQSPDLQLYKEKEKDGQIVDVNPGWSIEANTLTHPLSTDTYGKVSTIYLRVDCEDYAAYAELVLTASYTDTSDTDHTSYPTVIKIPKDTNSNKIADSWRNDFVNNYDPDSDADTGPNARTGDNITVLNEYRGLNVNGSWTDTDPDGWDVFISIDDSLSEYGIGTASALPSMTLHEMGTNEVTYYDGIVYHNQIARTGGSAPNYVCSIRLEADADSDAVNLDGSPYVYVCNGDFLGSMHVGPPSSISQGTIYVNRITTHLETCLGEDLSSEMQAYTEAIIGHEIAHGVNLHHCPCFDDVNCYMFNKPDAVFHLVTGFASHHNEDYALKNDDDFGFPQIPKLPHPDRLYVPGEGIVIRVDEDVNADGNVNILDLVIVASNLGGSVPHVADVNDSGSIDSSDLDQVANAMIITNFVCPTGTPEDVDRNGVVNVFDLIQVASNFTSPDSHGLIVAVPEDVNKDGFVNIQDLVLVANAIGNTDAASDE